MNAIRIDKSLINLCIDLRLRLRKKFSYFHIVISSSVSTRGSHLDRVRREGEDRVHLNF